MSSKFRVLSVDFPAEFVRQCSGIGVDIGGSAVKILFRTKESFDELEQNKSLATGSLHFLTCGRDDLDAALDSVKEQVHISEDKVYSCGVGGYQYNKLLQDTFGVKFENVVEGDCLVEGLKYFMEQVPEADLIYPPHVDDINEVTEEMMDRMAMHAKVYKDSKNKFFDTSVELSKCESRELSTDKSMLKLLGKDELYPYLVVQLGSNPGWIKVEKDGGMKFCDTNFRGGRFFMGVASLLTGVKSYDELMDLAEKGNNWAVDQSARSLSQTDDAQRDKTDPYENLGASKNEQMAYYFGRAVSKNLADFQREDLALSWLLQYISDIMGTTHHAVVNHDIKGVYVTGSLANREIVRKLMTRELIRQDVMMVSAYHKAYEPKLYFLKNGGHLCSMGTVINSVNKFTKDN